MMLSLEMVFEQLEDWELDSDDGHQGVTADHQYPAERVRGLWHYVG